MFWTWITTVYIKFICEKAKWAILHLQRNFWNLPASLRFLEKRGTKGKQLLVIHLCLPLRTLCTDPLKYSANFLGVWLVLFTLSSITWEIHCATGQSDSFHDAKVYGNCKSIKPQFALNKMKQQVVKWKLNPKLDNIFQEKSLSLLLLLLPSFEKFNRADWGNLERAGYSFLWFVIAP